MTDSQDEVSQMTSLTKDNDAEKNEIEIDRVPNFLVGKPLEDHYAKDSNVSV